jgi:hypothetical protein
MSPNRNKTCKWHDGGKGHLVTIDRQIHYPGNRKYGIEENKGSHIGTVYEIYQAAGNLCPIGHERACKAAFGGKA